MSRELTSGGENSPEFKVEELLVDDLVSVLHYVEHMISAFEQNRKYPDSFQGIPARIRDQIKYDCAPETSRYSAISKTWMARLIPMMEIAEQGVRLSQEEKIEEVYQQMTQLKDELETEYTKRVQEYESSQEK